MKENCLKAGVYEDEKRLLKANAITKFLILQNNWNELKKMIEEETKQYWDTDILDKMQELENRKV